MSACTCHDRVLELEGEVEQLRAALASKIAETAARDLVLDARLAALEAPSRAAAEDLLPRSSRREASSAPRQQVIEALESIRAAMPSVPRRDEDLLPVVEPGVPRPDEGAC